MPKISDVIHSYQLPSLNQQILNYFHKHTDEIFSAADAESLRKLINHPGSQREIIHSLWDLYEKGLISKERVGKWVYFGSREAIVELRKHTRPQKRALASNQDNPKIINISGDVPLALAHVLQVVHLVKKSGFSRIKATVEVADKWNVTRQNVQDKYCRQLGLTASEVDRLLKRPDSNELMSVLKDRFPEQQNYIDSFFSKLKSD